MNSSCEIYNIFPQCSTFPHKSLFNKMHLISVDRFDTFHGLLSHLFCHFNVYSPLNFYLKSHKTEIVAFKFHVPLEYVLVKHKIKFKKRGKRKNVLPHLNYVFLLKRKYRNKLSKLFINSVNKRFEKNSSNSLLNIVNKIFLIFFTTFFRNTSNFFGKSE